MTVIDKLVAEAVAREQAVIEMACESMLTDERGWGVRVDRYPLRVTAGLSPEVPFGEVHEHQHPTDTFRDTP